MKRIKFFTLVPVVGVAFAVLYTLSASSGGGQVSVPAAAFQPQHGSYYYTNDGNNVFNLDDNSQYWIAHVELPNGATVTKLTFYWNDTSSTYNARVDLYRGSWDSQSLATMATAFSSEDAGWGSTEDTSINYAVIDSGYGYFLRVSLPKSATVLCGVVIDYSYTASLPLILQNHQ